MFAFTCYICGALFMVIVLLKIRGLENKVEHLTVLATRDELTGVLNRRGGEDALRHQEKLSQREGSSNGLYSIITFDLNNFKTINDTHGHHIGDLVLKFFVSVIDASLRKDYDIVVRHGGDEFYAILPRCNLDEAKSIRAKIKEKFKTSPFKTNGTTLFIGTSVGIATSHKKCGKERTCKEMFKLADRLLYADKTSLDFS